MIVRLKALNPRLIALFILIIFVLSYSFIYNLSSFGSNLPEKSSQVSHIEEIDDYDAACSGYSVGRILREQKRILKSVRQELFDSQLKLDEIRTVQGELQKLIPQKQLELSSIEGEIEAAQRQLEELRENQNVRVSLPLSPLEMPNIKESRRFPEKAVINSMDDVIDYSRCSITSFFPISIELETTGPAEIKWKEAFQKSIPNLAKSPAEACLTIRITNGVFKNEDSAITNNLLVFNIGEPIDEQSSRVIFAQKSNLRSFDFGISLNLSESDSKDPPSILPYMRDNLILFIIPTEYSKIDITGLANRNETLKIVECSKNENSKYCSGDQNQELDTLYSSSIFCFLLPSPNFLESFQRALKNGCVPIVLSNDQILPFQDMIDWRLASYRIPLARLPESLLIVKSFDMADVLEMRRMGLNFYKMYLSSEEAISRTIISAMRYRLQIPTMETTSVLSNRAVPLFNTSFSPSKGTPVNTQPNFDDEYQLGPLENRVASSTFLHNFTEFQLYSHEIWNGGRFSPHKTPEFLINSHDPPAETEFHDDSKFGFRPIDPGSGVEFSRALGGNRQREQFTVVLLTYERDAVLAGALERLYQLPYLNKVIVIWNNVHREPPESWPTLHVPVEFIRVAENSLNNRFVPWDRIETEAVLSLDDDIDLMQQEIVFAFRVWRENRDRIVGFPARYHARYGDSMFYNSNHTCQMSIILTGAAFLHKSYFTAYTYEMPKIIRDHIDKVRNCEDIAMNYMVSHITRKPPIKTTSRWTLKCATCTERLSESDSHFEKRHECMRFFTKVFGYNPLKFSQFRADSILFKTRLPQTHQKCFKYV